MSILFVYLGNWAQKNVGSGKSFYKLILASNRIERYSRRVLPAVFWDKPDDHILADKNLDENHGTWLGVSTTGKLASVLRIKRDHLNVSTEDYLIKKARKREDLLMSRAALVPNFLQSHLNTSIKEPRQVADPNVDLSSWEFATILCEGAEHDYRLKRFYPFHFFGVDLIPKDKGDSIRATYLSNKESADINKTSTPIDITPRPGSCKFLGYGNSPTYKPFQKIIHGKVEFMEIVSNYMCSQEGLVIANEQNKASIKNELLDFLRVTRKYLPDPVILEYCRGERVKEKVSNRLSARFVTDYFDNGTRVQTIILVDTDNNVTFYEWLLEKPIVDPKNPGKADWKESVHNFKIKR